VRSDVNQYAIPGGFIDPGEKYPATLKREFEEESCQGTNQAILDKVFENGDIIYAGPTFDDPRTTDNAWIETAVVHYHISEELAKKIKLKPQPGETKKVEWIDCDANLYGGHAHFLKLVKNKMNNKYIINTIPINFEQFREVGSVFIYLIFVIFIMYQLLCVDKEIRLQEQIDKCIELDLFLEYSKINCTM
jgi:ADP-ribose pyrophosphatase YjhB (NUDIX family)